MSEKDELISKFTNKYNDLKNKEINNLSNKKKELQVKIQKEVDKSNDLTRLHTRIKAEEEDANALVKSLLRIVKSRGMIFNIHNKDFKVKEWDHLKIEKINGLYSFMSKNNENLFTLSKKYNDAIEYIMNNYSYSVVVIRMDSYLIKAQLRIIE